MAQPLRTDAQCAASRQPERVCRVRRVDAATEEAVRRLGWSELQARIFAGRVAVADPDAFPALLRPGRRYLTPPAGLPDIEAAVQRLLLAVHSGETIALVCDHDVDGVSSLALLYLGLTRVLGCPPTQIRPFIGHRLHEGYGLSAGLVQRLLTTSDPRPGLVITADQGSSDEARIAYLASLGIHTIVTDHHAIPQEGPPPSAFACVNPAREDSRYGDSAIAGCMVAWLLIGHAHRRLSEQATVAPEARGHWLALLDYVALGTIADCVTLGASANNRGVVAAGLALMAQDDARPCWRVARRRLTGGTRPLNEQDIAFQLAARINARGRLDEAMGGVRFLLAESEATAERWWNTLEAENETRKGIERALKAQALTQAQAAWTAGARGIVVWMPDGHPGVHGIVASRVVEAFGRPTVCLSPVHGSQEEVTGSARAAPGIHVKQAFDAVARAAPGLLLAHGGHAGAGGLRLCRHDIDRFRVLWEQVCATQVEARRLDQTPILWTDGECAAPGMEDIAQIDALGPYGRGFERPVFTMDARVVEVRAVGDGTHFRVRVENAHGVFAGIWFNAVPPEQAGASPVRAGGRHTFAYSPEVNAFRGQRDVQLLIQHVV